MVKSRLIYSCLCAIAICLLATGTAPRMQSAASVPLAAPVMPRTITTVDPAVIQAELVPQAYLPLVASSLPRTSWIDTQDRDAVRQLYQTTYLASDGISSGWTGSHASCNPGTTSDAFKAAILARINYFRSMGGVPPIKGFDASYNQKAQAAALMMSVNRALNHYPPATWTCYSTDGYAGASSSNLYLGVYGPSAISGYMQDYGSGNYAVGHRRWILYPKTQYMGTGDIPAQSGYSSSNALWVIDRDYRLSERPATREPYVAWPSAGYFPRQLVTARWSFSYDRAVFSAANVTVTRDGQPVAVTVSPVVNGYGENTLVWTLGEAVPGGDVVYSVDVRNVVVDSVPHDFAYQVRIFDAMP